MTSELQKQMAIEMKAFRDPRIFVEDILGIDWLWPVQEELIYDFYDGNYQQLVAVLGQRSGKTTAASIIATYELFKLLAIGKPCSYYDLPAGQDLYIICTASSAQQAKDTIYSQVEARIENCEWFKNYGYTKHSREFIFETDENEIYLRSEHSNSSSLAGHTCKAVLLDEMARFKDTGGHTSADMVYDTLSRTLATFGRQGKMVVISSPLLKDDFLMNLYRSGKEDPRTLTKHYATWEANPNITMEDLDSEFQRNPEAAWRDFGAQPSSSLEGYFKEQDRIDDVVDTSIELCPDEYTPPDIPSIEQPCYIAGDPATKNDAFGIAMCHQDPKTEKILVDIAHRFEPKGTKSAEVDAQKVAEFIVELAEKHNVVSFTTDVWSFQRALQRIEQAGIPVEQNHALKEEYDHLKELIYTNQIKLPDTKVVEELKSLEIKNAKKVDHPSKGSKDVSDAVCNAVWALEQKSGDTEEPIALVF